MNITLKKITNAYDAYWFLYNHPKFRVQERSLLPEGEDPGKDKVMQDRDGTRWRMHERATRHALKHNLDIFYTKVDEKKIVNKDPSKNTQTECWLEYGPEEWGYSADWEDGQSYLLNYHDPGLDCGAPTFDHALVILADNVLKKYGDYRHE